MTVILAFYITVFVSPDFGFSITSDADAYYFYAAMRPWDFAIWALSIGAYRASMHMPDSFTYTKKPAGLVRRLSGFFIDSHVTFLAVIVPLICLALVLETATGTAISWVVERSERRNSDYLLITAFLLAVFVWVLMLSAPLAMQKRSAGAITFGYGLKSSQRISLRASCNRTVLGFFTLCLGWISIPMAAFRSDRRMWHDIYHGVHPVKVERAA